MNQQTPNSSFIQDSSASNNPSPLASSGLKADPKQPAPADSPLPKAAKRSSKSPALANPGCPTFRAAKGGFAKNDDRCRHFTVTGRRCRLTALDPDSGLCFRHVARPFQPSDEDLSSAFVGLLSGFQSPSRIHAFLTQVTVLLVQNRISTRRAAILAYLGQTLLRTLPAIELELNPPEQEQGFIFDLPRPKLDDVISPERAFINRMAETYGSASRGSSPGPTGDNPAPKEST